MASTLLLRRRIKTAQNVSKTTRAMQMIAASKLKNAQKAALSSRVYVEKLSEVAQTMTNKVEKPLPKYMVERKKTGKTLLIIIAPDKGLCGSMITNLLKELLVKRQNEQTYFITVGKKVERSVTYIDNRLLAAFPFGNTLPTYNMVYPIVRLIDEQFLTDKVDSVEILSTHFISVFSQKPNLRKLLPLVPVEQETKTTSTLSLFEPDLETILPDMLKRYMEMIVYQDLLESYLSEQSARMFAMQNATNNAKDIIEDLRLEYNKSRQAKITSEILDISSGMVVQ